MMIGKVIVEDYIPNKVDTSKKIIEVKGISNKKLKNVSFRICTRGRSWASMD